MRRNTEKTLRRKDLIGILTEIDRAVIKEGYVRPLALYLIGGSYVAYRFDERLTKDVDFLATQRDYRALDGILAEIEMKRSIDIDVFPNGVIGEFSYGSFATHASKLPFSYERLNVFLIDAPAFILLKVLAGRDHDLRDVERVVLNDGLPPQRLLQERFDSLTFARGKAGKYRKRFEEFLQKAYGV